MSETFQFVSPFQPKEDKEEEEEEREKYEDPESLRKRLILEEEEREAKVFNPSFQPFNFYFSLSFFFLRPLLLHSFSSFRRIEETIVVVNVVNLKKVMFVNFNHDIVEKNILKLVFIFIFSLSL